MWPWLHDVKDACMKQKMVAWIKHSTYVSRNAAWAYKLYWECNDFNTKNTEPNIETTLLHH